MSVGSTSMLKIFKYWLGGAAATGYIAGVTAAITQHEQVQLYDVTRYEDPVTIGILTGLLWPAALPTLAFLHVMSSPLEITTDGTTYTLRPGHIKWYPAGGFSRYRFTANDYYRKWALATGRATVKKQ